MRVVLSTYGGRGDVEPMVGLAVQLRGLGAEVTVCAPPDWAERLAQFEVPLEPIGAPVRALLHGPVRPSEVDVPRRAAELIAEQFEKLPAVARDCDVLVSTGLFPLAAAAQSVAERLGVRYVHAAYCPIYLPSPKQRPQPLPGRPVPDDVTDPRELDELAIESFNALFAGPINQHRAAIGLAPVDNIRDQVITRRPWLAADPVLGPWEPVEGLDVTQTGAWTVPDNRPLPADLVSFLDAGDPPVYVGFGSMPVPQETARIAIDAVRGQGRRVIVAGGWAGLVPSDDRDDCFAVGEVNQQALFPRVACAVHHGGAGTTTAAARAGAPQVVVPQMADQPYWGGRVAALGIGVAHDGPVPTVESLWAALDVALAPETRHQAQEVAGTVRGDGAATAANLLLRPATVTV